MKITASLAALSLVFASAATMANESQQLSVSANGLKGLNVEAGAGSFMLTGSDTDRVQVEADIFHPKGDKPEFTLEVRGNTAYLVAKFPESYSFSGKSPYINVTVTMPQTLMLDLVDGSGDIEIRGLTSDIRVNDGSGNLLIEGGNQVSINDGSGDLTLTKSTGDVDINDGSGNITVSDISGNADIQDGSGDIRVTAVMGNAKIQDGSGNIFVDQAKGKVEITDGSGNINVKNAGGLIIHSDGSGSVNTANIQGDVILR
ncbi:DUF4097 family beta strand repeat-containing protein [Shewanella sp. FJAT-52076]|uniref:DUF4097 family beta strand repeat-containing protein n=1 Tax=Shewanella sp. FJAT-52076 TaxID=2864202 RepID=UPI001C65C455|nr:DUF4097 family beta strand repeat-containing protein [Shewanella sp. FJAT-52076]QYJ76187.1 hypothetical protein K0H79_04150 [Shewanella sp. FJAT-52076]